MYTVTYKVFGWKRGWKTFDNRIEMDKWIASMNKINEEENDPTIFVIEDISEL